MSINIPQGNFPIYAEYGRMQIFGVGADSNVYTMWKTTTDPNSAWSNWTNMGGGTAGIANDSTVTVGYLPDGRMEIFCSGNDGYIYSLWKVTADPNSAWSSWQRIGGPGSGAEIGYLPDQRIQVFVSGFDESIQSFWKTTTDSNSAWSSSVSIGVLPGGLPSAFLVSYLPDSRMQLFAVDGNAVLYSMWKTTTDPDSPWSVWESMGVLPGGFPNSALAGGYLPDGRMQIFIIANDQALYSRWKTTADPDSPWSDWTDMGKPHNTDLNWVSVGYLPDGRMQLFTPDTGGNVYSTWKTTTDPDSSWSNWASMGRGAELVANVSAIGYLTDGRMQLFAAALGYSIYSIWKTTNGPDSSWSNWASIGPVPTGRLTDVQVGYLPSEGN